MSKATIEALITQIENETTASGNSKKRIAYLLRLINNEKFDSYDTMNKSEILSLINSNSEFKSVIDTSTTFDDGVPAWGFAGEGIYPNADDIVVDPSKVAIITFDGEDFSSLEIDLPTQSDDNIIEVVEKVINPKKSIVVSGNFENELNRNFSKASDVKITTNQYLNNLGIEKLNYNNKGTNVENYWWAYGNNAGEPDGLANLLQDNVGKYMKVSWYIFSKDGIQPANMEAGRVGMVLNNGSTNYILIGSNSPNGSFNISQVDPQLFKVEKTILLEFTGTIAYAFFSTVLEAVQIPSNYQDGDFAFTGFKIAFADNPQDLYGDIIGDWIDEDAKIVDIVDSAINEKFKIDSFIKGGNLSPLKSVASVETYAVKSNAFLESIDSNRIATASKGGNGNVEAYIYFDLESRQKYLDNSGKFVKVKWKVFTKTGVMCTPTISGRLGIIGIQNSVSFSSGNVTYTQINANIYEVTAFWQINQTTLPNIIYLCSVWESDRVANDYVVGDLGITAVGVWYADTQEELADNRLNYDWIVDENDLLSIKKGNERYVQLNDLPNPAKEAYINVPFIQSRISSFLLDHKIKNVNAFNCIKMGLGGDSTYGRQADKAINPLEMSYTPDCNNPNETEPGFVTGHFPPNMWVQNVGYELLKMMQYKDADVKYYNHVASEVTKAGTWSDVYPVGADSLRLCRTSETNASIKLSFTGAKFSSFILSFYAGNGKTRRIRLEVSTNNGASWQKPSDLGLICSLQLDSNGELYLPGDYNYKWVYVNFSGYSENINYQLRAVFIDNVGAIDVWGFETWSNPRVQVIIVAEGGNTAASQVAAPERFCAEMYGFSLVIFNTCYLNDLGVGRIPGFGGAISISSVINNPTQYDFWFVPETNVYPNLGNLKLFAGDYVEWSGSAWRKGSTTLKNEFADFVANNKAIYKRASQMGVPLLNMITHESTSFNNKPYTWGHGLLLQRAMLKEADQAYIDINLYQKLNNLFDVYSDGTHLNDSGVLMHIEPLSMVLLPDNGLVGISNGANKYKPLLGKVVAVDDGNGNITYADDVSFGFEFKEVPTVRLYGTNRTLLNVTRKGFSTDGDLGFEWEAFVN